MKFGELVCTVLVICTFFLERRFQDAGELKRQPGKSVISVRVRLLAATGLFTLINPCGGTFSLYLNQSDYLGAIDSHRHPSTLLPYSRAAHAQSLGEHPNSTQTGPGTEDQFRSRVCQLINLKSFCLPSQEE